VLGNPPKFLILGDLYFWRKMDIEIKIKSIDEAIPKLQKIVAKCSLCVHQCGVNRLIGEKGKCRAGQDALVYKSFLHRGEEPSISGSKGSGTIFFSQCNMACTYCQNNQFSQKDVGDEKNVESLAEIMLSLQKKGCHNINLVSPTHYIYAIVLALKNAYDNGLRLPIVYNTGGYDSLEVIKLLDGIMDIYLPDMRYSCDEMAKKYSGVINYVSNNRKIVKEMFRQVGTLKIDAGVAFKGLIVRLLILPGKISGTIETMEYLSRNINREMFISIMSQYYPAYKALQDDVLKNRITHAEYRVVTEAMGRLGMTNGWVQPFFENVDNNFAGENF